MIFIRDAITDPETGCFVLRNVSGETAPKGAVACWATAAGSNPGADFSKPGGLGGAGLDSPISLFVGIVVAAIVNNARGLVQPFGYAAEALVLDHVSQAIAVGDILVPVSGQWYLARSGVGDGKSGRVHAWEIVAINAAPAAALRKVYIGTL